MNKVILNQCDNAKPFLSWVGGKHYSINMIKKLIPGNFETYHEPFLGSGKIFFTLGYSNSVISDINEKLIITYMCIRDNVEELIALTKHHFEMHDSEYFYSSRDKLNSYNNILSRSEKISKNTEIASLLIYLVKAGFCGLYRENKNGEVNMSIGTFKTRNSYDFDNLKTISTKLRNVDIFCGDFSEHLINRNDFYYMDPPYYSKWSSYSKDKFGENDHIRLYNYCNEIDRIGGKFLLSNSDTDFVRNLYTRYNIVELIVPAKINNANSEKRKTTDLAIMNY